MTIERSLHLGIRFVSLRLSKHPVQRQTHNLREQLADLILGEPVFGGEVQRCGQMGLVVVGEVFGC